MNFLRRVSGKDKSPRGKEKTNDSEPLDTKEGDQQNNTASDKPPVADIQRPGATQADPGSIDFTALRLAHAKENPYNPQVHNAQAAQLRGALADVVGDLEQGHAERAREAIVELLEAHDLDIEVHLLAAHIYKVANNERASHHQECARGLLDSIVRSGDGQSHQTAFVVINTREEYLTLNALGLQPAGQRLSWHEGQIVDILTVAEPKTGNSREMYFRIYRPV
jgi:hypothetical protein